MKKHFLLSITALLSCLLWLNAALAAPVLKAHISVDTDIVTVGDMFDNAGAMAEKGLFRSPAPGTTGSVPLASISLAAERAGLNGFDNAGLLNVRVERKGFAITSEVLNQLFQDEMLRRNQLGADQLVQFDNFGGFATLYAATNQVEPVNLVDFFYDQRNQRLQAKLAIAGRLQLLELDGRVEILEPTAYLRRTIAAGEIIGPDDVEFRPTPVRFGSNDITLSITDIVGKSLTRTIRQNIPLRQEYLSEPQIIARNQVVTIIYRQGALKLTVKGQALNAASANQPVSVLNLLSKKLVQGIATNNGTVLITNDPTLLASR